MDAEAAEFTQLDDSAWQQLDDQQRDAYDEARMQYHSELIVVETSTVADIVREGRLLMLFNRQERGARRHRAARVAAGHPRWPQGVPTDPPHADTDDEVTDEQPERLSTDAARVVLESCWAKGTPPAEAACLATRSTSYAKKVFARLDDARRPAPVPGQLSLVGDFSDSGSTPPL